MKKLLLIKLTLFSYLSYGQTEQGKITLGLTSNLNFSSLKVKDAEDPTNTLFINPKIGYFLIDDLSVGTIIMISSRTNGDFKERGLSIGPFARYYFLKEKIRPFLQTEYLFGSTEESGGNNDFKSTTETLILSGGAAFFINKYIAFDAQLSYFTGIANREVEFSSDEDFNFSGFGFEVGFSLFF